LHAIVEGHVQGVGFRYFVLEVAQQLKLSGWVRNLVNGNVELVAEGNRADLDKLYSALQSGSPGSLVTSVVCDWLPAQNTFTMFSIRPTA
jgi:acylphosphatase